MKVIALEAPDFAAKRITAYEAQRRKDAQLHDEAQTYYAFHNLEPMFVTRRGDKLFFKYKNGKAGPVDNNKNHMTVRHWLMESVLRNVRELSTQIMVPMKNGGVFIRPATFLFDDVRLECDVEYQSKRRRIDAIADLSPNCPNYGVIGPQLAIEICVTHRVTRQKSNVLKAMKLPCLEIHAHSDWQEPDVTRSDDREIRDLEKRMRGLYAKNCHAHSVGKSFFLKDLVSVA